MFRSALRLAVIVIGLVGCTFAQARPQYQISGRAVDAVTGQPLAYVLIAFGNAGDLNQALQTVITGDDGCFLFDGVPEGKYWLRGLATDYRAQNFEEHGTYSSAIAVGEGKESSNILFRFHRSASITGKIVDQEGEPVPDATILLSRASTELGYLQLLPVLDDKTNGYDKFYKSDQRGDYSISGLEAGRYYLAVSARPWFANDVEMLSRVDAPEPRDSLRSLISATYPLTFYPGVLNEESSAPIQVVEGQESVVNMELTSTPGARLTICGPDGTLSSFHLKKNAFGLLFDPPQFGNNGECSIIEGVPEGRYTLAVNEFKPKIQPERFVAFDVSGDTEISTNSTRPAGIRGTVLNRKALPEKALVRLWNPKAGQLLEAEIGPNGDFEFPTSPSTPGTYSVFVLGKQYSSVESISASRAVVIGQSLILTRQTPLELQIKVCEKVSSVEGVVTKAGRPTAGLMVVLVPDDFEHNLPKFRRDQSDSDGTFALNDVVPGHYKIVVLESSWNLEWAKLATGKSKAGAASKVVVVPSSKQTVKVGVP